MPPHSRKAGQSTEVNSLKRKQNDDSQSKANTSKRKRNKKCWISPPETPPNPPKHPPANHHHFHPFRATLSPCQILILTWKIILATHQLHHSGLPSVPSWPSKLKWKILAGKFVEMSDLLTRTNIKSSQEEFHMQPGKNNYSKFVKNQNVRNLPFFLIYGQKPLTYSFLSISNEQQPETSFSEKPNIPWHTKKSFLIKTTTTIFV